MEEVTVKNYQELAMRTCLPSAKNWDYCYCLIASEIGEAFGKWGKKFRDGEFDKDKLSDELGDVFWGLALACELGGRNFADVWENAVDYYDLDIEFFVPAIRDVFSAKMHTLKASRAMGFAKNFAKCVGIDPLDCLKRNIAKLADRQERGVIKGNGDER